MTELVIIFCTLAGENGEFRQCYETLAMCELRSIGACFSIDIKK